MNHVLLYSLPFILLVSISSCRTTTHSQRMEAQSTEERTTTIERTATDTASIIASREVLRQIAEHLQEHTTITTYRPDGTIQSVQKTRRTTGRTELADSSERKREISVKTENEIRKDTVIIHRKIKAEQDKKTDVSNPVKWVNYIAIAIITVAILLLIFKKII